LIDSICPECGNKYVITPYGKKMGYECPLCESKVSIQERFKGYIKNIDSSYVVRDEMLSLNRPVSLYHKTCGKLFKIKPRRFLFEGARCICENIITEDTARNAIESHKGFQLIKFTSANELIVVHSDQCGHEFECRYHRFIKNLGCRICRPKHMTPEIFEERIENLVGNEYEIIKGFSNQKTKIILRHKKCGIQQSYKPSAFLDGQRCHHCTKIESSWNEWYSLLKDYYREYGNIDIPKRESYKSKNLGQWMQKQREAYRNGDLSEYQISKLEELSFDYDPLETEWLRRYEQYKRYIVQNNGDTYISRRKDFEGEHLGTWVEIQRKRYKDGKLSNERAKMLMQIF